MSTTANLSLQLPTPLVSPGPAYAETINNNFAITDRHTHTPGDGAPIPTSALNINGQLTFNDNPLTEVTQLTFQGFSPTPAANTLTVGVIDLIWYDANQNPIQLTYYGYPMQPAPLSQWPGGSCVNVSGVVTILDSDPYTVWLASCASATCQITLPAATRNVGRIIIVKNIGDAGASHHVTISPYSGETIDTSTSPQTYNVAYQVRTYFSDGSNWWWIQ